MTVNRGRYGHRVEIIRLDEDRNRLPGPPDVRQHWTLDPAEARHAFAALMAEIEANDLSHAIRDTRLFSRRECDRVKNALRRAGFRGIGHGEHWGYGLRHPRHHGRTFRILFHLNRMDVCDGAFDRWANSLGASVPVPLTPDGARSALQSLIAISAPKVRVAASTLTHGLPSMTVAHRLSGFLRPDGYTLVQAPINHGAQVRIEHYDDAETGWPEHSWTCSAREWRLLTPWLVRGEPCHPRPRRGGWWVFALTGAGKSAVEAHLRLYHNPTAHDRMFMAARAAA